MRVRVCRHSSSFKGTTEPLQKLPALLLPLFFLSCCSWSPLLLLCLSLLLSSCSAPTPRRHHLSEVLSVVTSAPTNSLSGCVPRRIRKHFVSNQIIIEPPSLLPPLPYHSRHPSVHQTSLHIGVKHSTQECRQQQQQQRNLLGSTVFTSDRCLHHPPPPLSSSLPIIPARLCCAADFACTCVFLYYCPFLLLIFFESPLRILLSWCVPV